MNELCGVDASFDELTPQKAAALWADGKSVFAQCLWTGVSAPAVRVGNLQVAKAQGFITVGYISLTASFSGAWHVARAREGIPDDVWGALALAPIDIELQQIDNAQIRSALTAADATLGSAQRKRPCVYTSPSKWRDNQGDSHDFLDCLLWLAQYDGDAARINADLPGGWSYAQLVGKQYTNSMDVDGLNADSDVWDGDLLMETDAPTKEEFGALYAREEDTRRLIVDMGLTMHAVAQAFFDHVQHAGATPLGMQQELDEIKARLDAAAAALAVK